MKFLINKNLLFALFAASGITGPLKQYELVDISSINKNIVLDEKYIKTKFDRLITRKVAEKLDLVQKDLEKEGKGLKIKCAFKFMEVDDPFPKRYKNYEYGIKCHIFNDYVHIQNRGAVVYATLIDIKTKRELEMPTRIGDSNKAVNIDYSKLNHKIKYNVELLKNTMQKYGLINYPEKRWWFFVDKTWSGFPLYFGTIDLKEALDPKVGGTPQHLYGFGGHIGVISEVDDEFEDQYPDDGRPKWSTIHYDYLLNYTNFLN